MLISLSQELSAYLYDTFIQRFDFWLAFGVIAQLVFTARFLVQWIASEQAGRSIVPVAFWILSMVGGMMTLAYGIARHEAVIIMGQVLSIVIYVRNLMLIMRTRADDKS